MIPICYTASSVFWFQTEEEKFYEHFDDDKLEEVSKINDDDNGVDNNQNDVDFAVRNYFWNAAFCWVKEIQIWNSSSNFLQIWNHQKSLLSIRNILNSMPKIFACSSGNWKQSHSFICWNI